MTGPSESRAAVAADLRLKLAELADLPELAESLGADQPLAEAGVDSIATINLIVYIEQQYGLSLAEDELAPANFGTLGQIAALVDGKRGVKRP